MERANPNPAGECSPPPPPPQKKTGGGGCCRPPPPRPLAAHPTPNPLPTPGGKTTPLRQHHQNGRGERRGDDRWTPRVCLSNGTGGRSLEVVQEKGGGGGGGQWGLSDLIVRRERESQEQPKGMESVFSLHTPPFTHTLHYNTFSR